MTSKKIKTKKNLLDSVSKGFKKNGYYGVGVDTLAKEAGVTSGAFYAHMGSKQAAFEMALNAGLEKMINDMCCLQEEYKQNWLYELVLFYLSREHILNIECGCALAGLSFDVPKLGDGTKTIYSDKLDQILNLIADEFKKRKEKSAETKAFLLLGSLVGTINLLRGMKNNEELAAQTQKQILETFNIKKQAA